MVGSGVPSEVPMELTARGALREAMKLTNAFNQRLSGMVGVEDLGRSQVTPVFGAPQISARDIKKAEQNRSGIVPSGQPIKGSPGNPYPKPSRPGIYFR